MIASEQDKEREGNADAVGVNASTDQQQATGAAGGAKVISNHTSVSCSDNAAFRAAIEANDVAAMACVVGEGASVTAGLDTYDNAPLPFAARQGHVATMEWLVGQGADVHAKNKQGSTPLHDAAYIQGRCRH
jgi:ankyrin repeat protein